MFVEWQHCNEIRVTLQCAQASLLSIRVPMDMKTILLVKNIRRYSWRNMAAANVQMTSRTPSMSQIDYVIENHIHSWSRMETCSCKKLLWGSSRGLCTDCRWFEGGSQGERGTSCQVVVQNGLCRWIRWSLMGFWRWRRHPETSFFVCFCTL